MPVRWAWRVAALLCCCGSLALVVAGRAYPMPPHPGVPDQLGYLALTVVAAVTMTVGPGLALIKLGVWAPRVGMGAVPLPGFLLMAALGLSAWLLARWISPITTCAAGVAVVSAALGIAAAAPVNRGRVHIDHGALAVLAILLLIVVGRDLYSLGPTGELFGGAVSRSLEASDRPDSRISYHIVQLVAHGTDPHSHEGERNFRPYFFGSRGPITGLMSAPFVLAWGAGVPSPTAAPNEPWLPFDPEGFAAFRIAMEVFAAAALLSVFGLVAHLAGRDHGMFALLLAATTPFVVHETYFTWPKLFVGGLLVLAAHLCLTRRWARAGVVAGIAYLGHPLALIGLPTLWVVSFLRAGWRRALAGSLVTSVVMGVFFAGWYALNRSDWNHAGFLSYVLEANTAVATSVGQWLGSRLESLADTLIPMHLYVSHLRDPFANPVVIRRRVIVYFIQYWTSLPFAVGLLFSPLLLVGLVRAAIRHPIVVAGVVVGPLLLFAIYWGSYDTGLMREGLQGWLLGVLVVYCWYRATARWRAPWERWLLLSRIPETLAMLVMPAMWTQWRIVDPRFEGTDILGLAMMVVGLAAIAVLTWRAAAATAPADLGSGHAVARPGRKPEPDGRQESVRKMRGGAPSSRSRSTPRVDSASGPGS